MLRCKPKACLPFWQFHLSCTPRRSGPRPRPPTNHDAGAVGNYSITSIAARPLARHSLSSMADEARRVEMEAFSRHNHHRMQVLCTSYLLLRLKTTRYDSPACERAGRRQADEIMAGWKLDLLYARTPPCLSAWRDSSPTNSLRGWCMCPHREAGRQRRNGPRGQRERVTRAMRHGRRIMQVRFRRTLAICPVSPMARWTDECLWEGMFASCILTPAL